MELFSQRELLMPFVLLALGLALFIFRAKIFSVPEHTSYKKTIRFVDCCIALALYFAGTIGGVALGTYVFHSKLVGLLFSLIGAFVLLLAQSRILQKEKIVAIWGSCSAKKLLKGILFAMLVYPVVTCFTQMIHLLVDQIGTFSRGDQVALRMLVR